MPKIKICGLRRAEDVAAVNQYPPDYIGFVFAEDRKRYVPPKEAAALRRMLAPEITAVGVFVNADTDFVIALMREGIFEIAQLHGQESEEQVRRIKEATGKPVIKAVSVKTTADIDAWRGSSADYLLFDNGIGGTGRQFDWSLLRGYEKPFFLAGGINSANLNSALATGAYAVDISGGVETDGYKDAAKIAEAVRLVRAYSASGGGGKE